MHTTHEVTNIRQQPRSKIYHNMSKGGGDLLVVVELEFDRSPSIPTAVAFPFLLVVGLGLSHLLVQCRGMS